MEEFFRSLAEAFGRSPQGGPRLGPLVAVVGAVLAVTLLAALARRGAARRRTLRRLVAQRGLSRDDLRLAARVAADAGADLVAFLSRLDVFERATALALAQDAGAVPVGRELPVRLRALRAALGFDRLPPHVPLLSSRELSPGTAVRVLGREGPTFDVAEDRFAVDLAEPVALAPGQRVTLGLVHAREARYALKCRVLHAGPGPEGRFHLVLAHDEAPERIQQRAHARVAVSGPLTLRPAAAWPGPGQPTELRCKLLDVSGGGAMIGTAEPLPVGLLAWASFAVSTSAFAGVRAVVLGTSLGPSGWRAHLDFTGLGEAERDRLVAAVTRVQLDRAREQLDRAQSNHG